jgi:hypothetical protein
MMPTLDPSLRSTGETTVFTQPTLMLLAFLGAGFSERSLH